MRSKDQARVAAHPGGAGTRGAVSDPTAASRDVGQPQERRPTTPSCRGDLCYPCRLAVPSGPLKNSFTGRQQFRVDACMASYVVRADSDVEQLRADILRAVRKVCPRSLSEEAEDLAQVATSRILDRMRATAGSVEFSIGYLYRTAYSVVIDEIRRRRRLREEPIEPDLHVHAGGGNPERQAIAREARDAVAQCLAAMAASRRRAVTLHLLGHSNPEISALLECRPKQAENLVYRGLADLRTCLRARGIRA